MKLTNWTEQRGAVEVAKNVRGTLVAIDHNEELIKMTLAVPMSRAAPPSVTSQNESPNVAQSLIDRPKTIF
ncbi:hypothetical protein [Pseudomonas azerbaijanoccidentalis]